MKILQIVGHNYKWNLDSHFQNKVGSGFVFCAYSFGIDFTERKSMSEYEMDDILDISSIDLQYFGKSDSRNLKKGNLNSYPFHPSNITDDSPTSEYIINAIKQGIIFQEKLGLEKIIIPNYYENDNIDQLIWVIKTINKWLAIRRKSNHEYFMTVPFTNHTIIDEIKVENILFALTDAKIEFDGYYIVCESKPEYKQKVSIDTKYLRNLSRVFSVLKKQRFTTIYGYANWDAMIFLSLSDIDYITIATYENMRNFSIKRFISTEGGGPSEGWYYSEKLLNFIKAQFIDLIREKDCIDLIENSRNIYSDIILEKYFKWNNHKPEVHKNYLIAISKNLEELGKIENLKDRKNKMLGKIDRAIDAYAELEYSDVYLLEESRNYHLAIWKSFLLSR